MARTILDITRLLTRASHPAATGVDRVELAYAKRLLGAPQVGRGFAAVVRGRTVPLPDEAVAAFVQALDAQWRAGAGNPAAARRVAEWLGAPAPEAAAQVSRAGEAARRALRLRLGAALTTRAAPEPGDLYVHVSHLRLDRPEVFAGVRKAGAALAIMVHDLIPIRFPEYGRAGEAERHARRMNTALRYASTLIANSAETARDLSAYATETGQPVPPVVVAPLGVESGFARAARPLAAERPYFVALGTIEPRKNHLLLLHVWRRLAERLGPATPRLVLVGRRGWENEMVVDLLERCPAVRAHVLEVNELPDEALASLVAGARALLFPSFSEGFGLPLAETLAMGAPAIVSDLAVFREVAGDLALRLDPLDGPAWEKAIVAHATEHPEQGRRATEYQPPRWEEHFGLLGAAGLAI
ncbi:glycosyltransferase family 4 protein [Hansschlegelia beijingensis]|uniref:Glycosyltransferase involved in cell wall biosynthesis n=1 Tax=Hansschlegelia beijingensis TaxID=1133344 RepID=A0A7W6GGF2_9HYPH|nr:glycosyltransferase family 1 protein [Hansschlegelia beijingensis]MBB3973967.1 glycosyltransferase involved in cell wall biosynthesis [Hansschlegelia beijingensis]